MGFKYECVEVGGVWVVAVSCRYGVWMAVDCQDGFCGGVYVGVRTWVRWIWAFGARVRLL